MKAALADFKTDQSFSMQSIAAALVIQIFGFSLEGIET